MAHCVEHHPLDAAFAALLANGLDSAGEALRILVNEASKIERAQFLNARPHERTADRINYANGFKPKTVMTRVGQLTFDVPQVRGGGFYPAPWRRARLSNRRSTSRWPRCTSRASPPARSPTSWRNCWGRRYRSPRPRPAAPSSSSTPAWRRSGVARTVSG